MSDDRNAKIAKAQALTIKMAYLSARVSQEMRDVRDAINLRSDIGPSYLGMIRNADRMRKLFVELDELSLQLRAALRECGLTPSQLSREPLAYVPSIEGEDADVRKPQLVSDRAAELKAVIFDIASAPFMPATPVETFDNVTKLADHRGGVRS